MYIYYTLYIYIFIYISMDVYTRMCACSIHCNVTHTCIFCEFVWDSFDVTLRKFMSFRQHSSCWSISSFRTEYFVRPRGIYPQSRHTSSSVTVFQLLVYTVSGRQTNSVYWAAEVIPTASTAVASSCRIIAAQSASSIGAFRASLPPALPHPG